MDIYSWIYIYICMDMYGILDLGSWNGHSEKGKTRELGAANPSMLIPLRKYSTPPETMDHLGKNSLIICPGTIRANPRREPSYPQQKPRCFLDNHDVISELRATASRRFFLLFSNQGNHPADVSRYHWYFWDSIDVYVALDYLDINLFVHGYLS